GATLPAAAMAWERQRPLRSSWRPAPTRGRRRSRRAPAASPLQRWCPDDQELAWIRKPEELTRYSSSPSIQGPEDAVEQENVTFENGDGHELAGVLHRPSAEPAARVLFAHCFTCTKNVKAAVHISQALVD